MKLAPATFLGLQINVDGKPFIALYNLTEPIPGYPKGSTLARATIVEAGFYISKRESFREAFYRVCERRKLADVSTGN